MAAARLAAEAPRVDQIGEAVGDMLSGSVLADEIGEKVDRLMRARDPGSGASKSQAKEVLAQLDQLQGDAWAAGGEEELESDSRPLDDHGHDDWRRQLEAEVAVAAESFARGGLMPETYGGPLQPSSAQAQQRKPQQRMMVAQSPEQELDGVSYLQREPDPASTALGFLAEFRSSSRPTGDQPARPAGGPEEQPESDWESGGGWTAPSASGSRRDEPSTDFSESDQERTVLPANPAALRPRQQQAVPQQQPSPGRQSGGGKAARAPARNSALATRTSNAAARPADRSVRDADSDAVVSLRAERDAALDRVQLMEEKQNDFLDAQERDLQAIEKRGSTQAAKLKTLAHENEDLRAELEQCHADLDDGRSGADGALARQTREHERLVRQLEERLADAEQGMSSEQEEAAAKLEKGQTQLQHEVSTKQIPT